MFKGRRILHVYLFELKRTEGIGYEVFFSQIFYKTKLSKLQKSLA